MITCRKHFPNKPVITSLEISEPTIKSKDFHTGSSYEGDWSPGFGMHGHGVYTFPNGVVYEGEFKDGTMHGNGELLYQTPNGRAIVRGQWKDGILADRTILFDEETLEYDNKDWKYCKMPDRRYSAEYANGLQPGGNSFLTAYQPPIPVPENCFDTGDGLYDRKRQMIYEYDDLTKIVRSPSLPEKKWIKENCRMGEGNMTIGPREDFYETYVEPTEFLEPNLPPAAKYIEKLKRLSAFYEESNARFIGHPIEVYREYNDREEPDNTVIDSTANLANDSN